MPIPYSTPTLYRPGDNSIAQLISRSGDIRARGAERNADLWGNVVSQIGQLGAQAVGSIQEEKQQKKRTELFNDALTSWDPTNPTAFIQKAAPIVGPTVAIQGAKALSALAEDQQAQEPDLKRFGAKVQFLQSMFKKTPDWVKQNWEGISKTVAGDAKALHNVDIGSEWDDVYGQMLEAWTPEQKPQGEVVKTVDELGNPIQKFASQEELARGVPMVPPSTDKPEYGSFEEYASLVGADTPDKLLQARQEWSGAGRDPNAPDYRETSRLDRSYQYNSTQLQQIAKPIIDQAERFDRLKTTVDQRTPQADALIAPELLTVMAGGQGSGLRMNEAEISRIIGGRSNYEGLKAKLNKWSLDPTQALQITDAQREQIKSLIEEMGRRIERKKNLIVDAQQNLVDAADVTDHRRVLSGLRNALIGGESKGEGWTEVSSGIRIREKK